MSPAPELPAPPAATRRWLGALVALAVTVPIGMAPLLGTWDVPGFKALLTLYPSTLRETALPLASLAMALVAISVQFFSRDTFSGRRLQRWFIALFAGLFVTLLLLAYVHSQNVVRVYIGDGSMSESYVVGRTRKSDCSCPISEGDAKCITRIGLDPQYLSNCWDERETRMTSFYLTLLYVLMMSGTGALVGLLVMVRTQRKRPAKRAAARVA